MNFYLLRNKKKEPIEFHDPTKKPMVKKPGRSVVKITAHDKFLINKCGPVEWVAKKISETIRLYHTKGVYETDHYYSIAKYIVDNDIKQVVIEILFTSENGYEVLKFELEQLMEVYGKRDCLNKSNVPYVPKTVRAKKGSDWLTVNQYLNYMKLLKNYTF